jgi:hypothetical protein
MCFKSGCVVEMDSCVRWDVGIPNGCSIGRSVLSGMSSRTLLRTTLLDAITYGLHGMKVSCTLIPPGVHSSWTNDSAARYTQILPPLSREAYLMLVPPMLSAIDRRYCSSVNPSIATNITPHLRCGV